MSHLTQCPVFSLPCRALGQPPFLQKRAEKLASVFFQRVLWSGSWVDFSSIFWAQGVHASKDLHFCLLAFANHVANSSLALANCLVSPLVCKHIFHRLIVHSLCCLSFSVLCFGVFPLLPPNHLLLCPKHDCVHILDSFPTSFALPPCYPFPCKDLMVPIAFVEHFPWWCLSKANQLALLLSVNFYVLHHFTLASQSHCSQPALALTPHFTCVWALPGLSHHILLWSAIFLIQPNVFFWNVDSITLPTAILDSFFSNAEPAPAAPSARPVRVSYPCSMMCSQDHVSLQCVLWSCHFPVFCLFRSSVDCGLLYSHPNFWFWVEGSLPTSKQHGAKELQGVEQGGCTHMGRRFHGSPWSKEIVWKWYERPCSFSCKKSGLEGVRTQWW